MLSPIARFFFERFGVSNDSELLHSPKFYIPSSLATLSAVALFIIGCLGAAGVFPSAALGGCVIGLSGASFGFYLLTADFEKHKTAIIIHAVATAIFILIGTCGLTNLLYPMGVGILVIVATVLKTGSFFIDWRCCPPNTKI